MSGGQKREKANQRRLCYFAYELKGSPIKTIYAGSQMGLPTENWTKPGSAHSTVMIGYLLRGLSALPNANSFAPLVTLGEHVLHVFKLMCLGPKLLSALRAYAMI